jgi:hypothetical protein
VNGGQGKAFRNPLFVDSRKFSFVQSTDSATMTDYPRVRSITPERLNSNLQ